MNRRVALKEVVLETLKDHGRCNDGLLTLPEKIGLSIDSRTIIPGEIFFAIKGEFNDGHNFINDAILKKASLIVAEHAQKHALNHVKAPIIFVDDSLRAFSDIARRHLRRIPVAKIAITGSNGKTSTKEMLKALLIELFSDQKVYASAGNKNNHFGVPLSALEVEPHHQFAIFELGMNHAGEISTLCNIVEPDFGAITNISFAHQGNFLEGIEGVAHAKGELFEALSKRNGHAIINADDNRVVGEAARCNINKRTTFGTKAGADVKIVAISPYSFSRNAQEITILANENSLRCLLPLPGDHQAKNAACALAIVKALNLSLSHAAPGLMKMTKIAGRMNITQSKHGYLLINDGYNANPASMKAGIAASREFSAKRRIAAIGAMGELGEESEKHHFELGQLLANSFDRIFICGDAARHTVLGAKNAGMAEEHIVFKDSSQDLIKPLMALLKDGDLVFIKGSLSANMLAVANALQT